MANRRISCQTLGCGAVAAQRLTWKTMAQERAQAEDCLKVLLAMEHGLRDSEIKWIDIVNNSKRPLTRKFVNLVIEIYDRRCVCGEEK